MPWFRFDRDFDWQFHRRAMKAFKAGQTVMVTTPCAKKAKAAGAGAIVARPAHLKTTKCGKTIEHD